MSNYNNNNNTNIIISRGDKKNNNTIITNIKKYKFVVSSFVYTILSS